MTLAIYALIGVGIVQTSVTCWLLRGLRRVDRVDERLERLTEALRLLAETAEAGFAASASELTRLAEKSDRPRAAAPARSTLRATKAEASPRGVTRAAAARKGRTAGESASPESMSEGEQHLRLHMAAAQ